MVRKETCPDCKGNRFVKVDLPAGRTEFRKCASCHGNGFRVRIVRGRY